MFSRILKNRAFAGVLIGTVITGLAAVGILTGTFNDTQLNFADSLYTNDVISEDIVIIAIDDKSTKPLPEGLGRFSQWSRESYSQLIDVLEKEGPAVIAFDLVFNTPTSNIDKETLLELKTDSEEVNSNKERLDLFERFVKTYALADYFPSDEFFSSTIEEYKRPIILGATLDEDDQLIQPLRQFQKGKVTLGLLNTYIDDTGILRKAIPQKQIKVGEDTKTLDDISMAAAKIFMEKNQITTPIDENGETLVNFFGEPFSYKMIPFIDVLNKNYEKGDFKEKIVLVGTTSAKEVHDEYLTPKSNKAPMPGVEFRANEIQTYLDSTFLNYQSNIGKIITVAVISILLTILLNYLNILFSVIASALGLLIYLGLAHFFFKRGLILDMLYPFAAIVLVYFTSWVYKYFIADKGKREIKSAFGHYVSEKLVDQISENPDVVQIGGEKKDITVFFMDIKNSTGLSESIQVEAWVKQINEYFTAMERVIKRNDGTIDKYEGDAIMGFWNAPVPQTNHITLAFDTAIGMRSALASLHQKWQKESKPLLEFRIGINTGEAIVGNFGSNSRFDFTVMGDTVNTASRLESSANKTYGTTIIVANFENKIAAEEAIKYVFRELDWVLLPGKKQAITIYELVCTAEQSTPQLKALLQNYAGGLAAYRKKDYGSAIQFFATLNNDPAALVMIERCKKLQAGQSVPGLDETSMVYRIVGK